MKKNYMLWIAMLCVAMSYGQANTIFEATTDELWSNELNWFLSEKPVTGDYVLMVSDSEVDEEFTVALTAVLDGSSPSNRIVTSSGSGNLIIDVNTDSNIEGFVNSLSSIYTVDFSAKTEIVNSANSNRYTQFVSENGSKINFTGTENFTLKTNLIIDNAGETDFNRPFVQDGLNAKLRLSGGGNFNFKTAYVNIDVRNVFAYETGATLTFEETTTAAASSKNLYFQKGSSASQNIYTLNLSAENSLSIANLRFNEYSTTAFNIDENNAEIGTIRLQDGAIVNLNIAAGKECSFKSSNLHEWGTLDGVALNITGYDFTSGSNIRFGTTSSGLSSNQIAHINLVGGDNDGDEVMLDDDGYLVLFDAATATTKTMNTSGGNWATSTDWDENFIPVDGNNVLVTNGNSTMDISSDLRLLSFTSYGAGDITINKSGNNALILDANLEARSLVFKNFLDDGELIFNSLIEIDNDSYPTEISEVINEVNGNVLTFGSASVFNSKSTVYVENNGQVNFEGILSADAGVTFRLEGNGDYTFASTVAGGTYSMDLVEINNNGGQVTFEENTSFTDGTVLIDCNGGNSVKNYIINLNGVNSLIAEELETERNVNLTVNVNAANENIGILDLGENSVVNLNLDSNDCSFNDSSGAGWSTGALNITGFTTDNDAVAQSNVRFGTDANALTATQLSQISVDLADDQGGDGSVILNEDGYLIFESVLSVTNVNAIDFAIYPNPVVDVLTITSEENIAKYEVLNLVGTTVVSVSSIENGLDVSNLTSGVYILRLSSVNGISTAKFVKK